MQENDEDLEQGFVLRPVAATLPDGFAVMQDEARAEGFCFLDRLATEWAAGAQRFDREGEALLFAYRRDALAAVGGITWDPELADALRMRRFYVRSCARRLGIAGALAKALIAPRLAGGRRIVVNAGTAVAPAFWERLGFTAAAGDGHTHVLSRSSGP